MKTLPTKINRVIPRVTVLRSFHWVEEVPIALSDKHKVSASGCHPSAETYDKNEVIGSMV
jgi:hypothetical protein